MTAIENAPPPPVTVAAPATLATRLMRQPTDWLAAVLVSWILPLELLGFPSTYLTSLAFWLVPVILLLPRLYHETDAGGRRRRAFWLTTAFIFVAGCALDFVFGEWILEFDSAVPGPYVWRFPFGQHIPIEEVLFYLLGGMAIVLVYIWADEYWMKAYNVRQRRTNQDLFGALFRLVEFSPHALAVGAGLFLLGMILKWRFTGQFWPPPYYFTFLVLLSFVPAVLVYRNVKQVVNWRAFSFTCLWVLVTSCIWEVTLGIARSWWWYQPPPAIIGWTIPAFGSLPARPYPIEALLVWLAVSFNTIFAYEFLKGITYDERSTRQAMLG
jgi:hypothetical protein